MTGLREYLFAGACIFAINLLPAFAPPTWALLVVFKLDADLATVPLVLGGAAAAATGRLVLACSSRGLRRHFSARRLESLAAAQRALTGDRRRSAGGLALVRALATAVVAAVRGRRPAGGAARAADLRVLRRAA